MHCCDEGQETAVNPSIVDGGASTIHVLPLSVDFRIEDDPTAKHVIETGHESEAIAAIPNGGVCDVQVAPPFVVAIIREPSSGLPLSPTAVHVNDELHESPVSSIAVDGTV